MRGGLPAQLFDATGRVAIGFNRICWLLRDEEISHAMKTLHAWAGNGSRLFMADVDSSNPTPELAATMKLYENFGKPVHLRSLNVLEKLVAPWKPTGGGFRPLEEWIRVKEGGAGDTQKAFGGVLKGASLDK